MHLYAFAYQGQLLKVQEMEILLRLPNQMGAALRRARRLNGLSQAELAELTRLRQATISNVESGDTDTQLDTIFRLLSALDLEIIVRTRTKAGPDDFMKLVK